MTASGPDGGATPNEPHEPGGVPHVPGGVPHVPEDVWRRFLEDDERAIRASALREPAARERTPGWRPAPPPDPWPGPAWRELDRRARVRRVCRVLGTAAAVALALTAWSQLSTGPGTPGGEPADTIGRRLEESPVLPSAATPAPTASASTGPAVFEPDPSAVPRASLTSWTTG